MRDGWGGLSFIFFFPDDRGSRERAVTALLIRIQVDMVLLDRTRLASGHDGCMKELVRTSFTRNKVQYCSTL